MLKGSSMHWERRRNISLKIWIWVVIFMTCLGGPLKAVVKYVSTLK